MAPATVAPLRSHWYVRLAPVAVTLNVTVLFACTNCDTGCTVISGAPTGPLAMSMSEWAAPAEA